MQFIGLAELCQMSGVLYNEVNVNEVYTQSLAFS